MSHYHVDGQTCHKIASRTLEDGAKGQGTIIEGLGSLIPLKTILELRREDAIVQVYIAKVPVKVANEALR